MRVFINDVEVEYLAETLSIEWERNLKAVARFKVLDRDGTISILKGQTFEVQYNNGTRLMKGVIEKPVWSLVIPEHDRRVWDITGVDNRYFLSKRRAARSYQNKTAGYIIQDLFNQYMSAEGVTIGEIHDGPEIAETVFNYIPVDRAGDKVAEKTGMVLQIDDDKKLYLLDQTAYPAPFTLTYDKVHIGPGASIPKIDGGNLGYRNRQIGVGARDVTTEQEAFRTGDGYTRTFLVDYPLAFEPTVSVSRNGGPYTGETVGIRGLETGTQWFWNKEDDKISQNDNQTILTANDRVRFLYHGFYDIVVIVSDQGAITALDTIESGSGIVENVMNMPELGSYGAALEAASDELQKNSATGYKLKFSTLEPGLKPGQLLPVNLPRYGITGLSFLIDKVTFRDADVYQLYNVEASYGYTSKSWTQFFVDMVDRSRPVVVRENISEKEALRLVQTYTKTWIEAENPNIFKELYFHDDLPFDDSNTLMFEYDHRIRYVAAIDADGNELGRRAVAFQNGADTDRITSRFILGLTDCLGNIVEFAWFGGYHASSTEDSGIEVDRQAYVHTKTSLETIQVERTDIKGW
jgi:hypothetical protein